MSEKRAIITMIKRFDNILEQHNLVHIDVHKTDISDDKNKYYKYLADPKPGEFVIESKRGVYDSNVIYDHVKRLYPDVVEFYGEFTNVPIYSITKHQSTSKILKAIHSSKSQTGFIQGSPSTIRLISEHHWHHQKVPGYDSVKNSRTSVLVNLKNLPPTLLRDIYKTQAAESAMRFGINNVKAIITTPISMIDTHLPHLKSMYSCESGLHIIDAIRAIEIVSMLRNSMPILWKKMSTWKRQHYSRCLQSILLTMTKKIHVKPTSEEKLLMKAVLEESKKLKLKEAQAYEKEINKLGSEAHSGRRIEHHRKQDNVKRHPVNRSRPKGNGAKTTAQIP